MFSLVANERTSVSALYSAWVKIANSPTATSMSTFSEDNSTSGLVVAKRLAVDKAKIRVRKISVLIVVGFAYKTDKLPYATPAPPLHKSSYRLQDSYTVTFST